MGKAQTNKAERRAAREAQAVDRSRRRVYAWSIAGAAVGLGALIAAVLLIPQPNPPGPQAIQESPSPTPTGEGPQVVIETAKGTITMELYPEAAPQTVEQITSLVEQGFYDGLTFHRVEPGFVVQGGDPNGDGSGGYTVDGQEVTISFEENDLTHRPGAVAMARSQDPDSASSQFYIALDELPSLDGNYVVFGQVIDGFDVVSQIEVGDVMTDVRLAE